MQALKVTDQLFFHGASEFDAALIDDGSRHWATTVEKLSADAREIGGNRNLPKFWQEKNLSVTSQIPPDIATKYKAAFSGNIFSWWKGWQGQFSYQASGWRRSVLQFSEGATSIGVFRGLYERGRGLAGNQGCDQ